MPCTNEVCGCGTCTPVFPPNPYETRIAELETKLERALHQVTNYQSRERTASTVLDTLHGRIKELADDVDMRDERIQQLGDKVDELESTLEATDLCAKEWAGRVAELEVSVAEECRLNGMGAQRELKLETRVRELERINMQTNKEWFDSYNTLEAAAREALGSLNKAANMLERPGGSAHYKFIEAANRLRAALGERMITFQNGSTVILNTAEPEDKLKGGNK